MAYVAVKGGKQAIDASQEFLLSKRLKSGVLLDVQQVRAGLRVLIDQVMAEASMYDEQLAALAIKQAEGSPEEAVFLLRAYRSTLQRKYESEVVDTGKMRVERRISAAFKDIPGGQILGASPDYTHRLLDFDLFNEKQAEPSQARSLPDDSMPLKEDQSGHLGFDQLPKVVEYLRDQGLLARFENNDTAPSDVTKKNLEFPSNRSQRLQIMARGQTGAVTSLGYASLRGYGAVHPTVAELRVGDVPVYVAGPPPMDGDAIDEQGSYYIGEFRATEVESLVPVNKIEADGKQSLSFELGYGLSYGQNETKTIAMSLLDQCLEHPNEKFATHDEEFVLLHIDSVESSGFISHLKLPHYVTFQSKLVAVRASRQQESPSNAQKKTGPGAP